MAKKMKIFMDTQVKLSMVAIFLLAASQWVLALPPGHSGWYAGRKVPAIVISGKVTDANGPLAGVSVRVNGTRTGTTTNESGSYSINAAENATLIFSYAGYKERRVAVNGQTVINVVLEAGNNQMEEVIVTGYRTQKRGTVTGAVSSVNGSEFRDAPADNLSNALAGRLSGVTINQGAGTPGMESSIRVRAQGTFNNAAPLFVIDGIVSDKFAFDGLSPNEVESITVLKDGASAAIYGSRAANGVVLVTTRRGREGAPKFSYNGLYGVQTPTMIPRVLTAYEHATGINNALLYNKVPTTDPRYYTPDELEYFKTHSWDWIDAMWENPTTTQHNADVSGGSNNVKYFLGGSYNHATGSFNNLDFTKLGLRANIDVSLTRNFKISLDLNTDKRSTDGPSWQVDNWRQEDLYKALLIRSPMVPPYVNGLPVGNWVEWHPGVVVNPDVSGYNRREWVGLNSMVTVNYTAPFVKGLSAKASLNRFGRNSYTKQFNLPYNMTLFNTLGGHNHIVGDQVTGIRPRAAAEFLQSRLDKLERYQFNGQVNYKRRFGRHNIDALAVYEQSEEYATWFSGRRDDFISPSIDQYIGGSTVNSTVDGRESQGARISYVGLASYSYADKYLLEGSFRYDGSVIFSPERRWGFFPSVSAGWNISHEPFFKNVHFINDLKLRGSVAKVGNDAVDAFQWMQSYNIVNGAIFTDPTIGLQPGVLANPNITWEKSLSYNAGLDSRFLDNLTMKLDLFYRHTYDILGTRQQSIPSTFGADMPDENYQQVNAKGFEVELGYNNKVGKGHHTVTYYARGNFSYSTNKVVLLDEAENIRPYQSKIGRPINGIFGYVADQILRTQADLDALPAGYTILGVKPQLGMLNYRDLRGPNSDKPDGRITSDDQEFIADYTAAPMSFGLSFGGAWKSISVDVLFQGLAGAKAMLPTAGRDFQARAEESSFGYWADSWTPENPNGKYPGYRGTGYRTRYDVSTFWLQDLSFVRLKNLTVSYSLPRSITKKLNMSTIRTYFTGTNLWLPYRGEKLYDPEINNITSYPMMKTFSFGLNIGL